MTATKASSNESFESHRKLLFGLAYRMLGTVQDTEDVIQDTYIRWMNVDQETIESTPAYLTRIAIRLCIDRLRRLKVEREAYVGPWLPEPIPITLDPPSVEAELAETLSVALLVPSSSHWTTRTT